MRESDSLVPPVPDVRGSGLSSHRKPMMMRVFIATVVIGASSLLVYALPNLVLVTSPYPAARFATPLDGAMHHVPSSTWRWVEDVEYCTGPPTSFLCTPSGWAWRLVEAGTPQLDHNDTAKGEVGFVDGEQACSALKEKGVGRVLMAGDSFIRHAYEALAMTLSADYETGGVDEAGRSVASCHGEGQFEEKTCRHFVPASFSLCGGQLHLALAYGAWVPLTAGMGSYDVIVWGGGEHPTDLNYETRHGVNDAAVVEEEVFRPVCRDSGIPWLPVGTNTTEAQQAPRLFWQVPHTRLSGLNYTDQTMDVVRRYAKASVHSIRRQCGAGVVPIDVQNFTEALVKDLPDEAGRMTWDGCHWGRAVNLVKAQMILQAITTS